MNGPLLRLLDANANRAREALRVLEDHARFILDNRALSASLKGIRHDLRDATTPFLAEAILHRDTPGDVGTLNKTEAELSRASVEDVVTAAGKRLGEALRAIEEFLKVLAPVDAARVEAIRYRFYDVEMRIARTLRPAACGFATVGLYVLITESACSIPWLDAAEQAILGGADCLQLREKDLQSGELLARARNLVHLCRDCGVLCIINDRPDIALLAGADGVHVGQGDLPAVEVRKLLGPNKIVGVSTHEMAHARQAMLDGADYLGVGPFFRSSTKPRDFVAGPAYAAAVARSIPLPAIAIAGITAENVDEVLATGLKAIAVTGAVVGAKDVRAAAARLKAKLTRSATSPPYGVHQTRSSLPVAQALLPVVSQTPPPMPVAQAFLPAAPQTPPSLPVAQAFLPVVSQTFLSVPRLQDPNLKITRRNLPHWRLDGATYFITFRLLTGELNQAERQLCLEHIKFGHRRFYTLFGTVIMPDHAHLILTPNPGVSLERITKGTKGVLARRINERRGTGGPLWQDEGWDRIVRDQDELNEKIGYIIDNPVKAGLVKDGWAFDALYVNDDASLGGG